MKTIAGVVRFKKNEDLKSINFPNRFFVTVPLVKTITNNNSFVLVENITTKKFSLINTSGAPTTVYFSAVSRPVNFNINDLDQDGIQDNLDNDRDGDGINNVNDLFPIKLKMKLKIMRPKLKYPNGFNFSLSSIIEKSSFCNSGFLLKAVKNFSTQGYFFINFCIFIAGEF